MEVVIGAGIAGDPRGHYLVYFHDLGAGFAREYEWKNAVDEDDKAHIDEAHGHFKSEVQMHLIGFPSLLWVCSEFLYQTIHGRPLL